MCSINEKKYYFGQYRIGLESATHKSLYIGKEIIAVQN